MSNLPFANVATGHLALLSSSVRNDLVANRTGLWLGYLRSISTRFRTVSYSNKASFHFLCLLCITSIIYVSSVRIQLLFFFLYTISSYGKINFYDSIYMLLALGVNCNILAFCCCLFLLITSIDMSCLLFFASVEQALWLFYNVYIVHYLYNFLVLSLL